MDLLERKNWWVWLILYFMTGGVSIVALAASLEVYEKDAWYTKWQYWFIAGICCIFPLVIMFNVFLCQLTVMVAKKLDVPGHEVYASPYAWILCIIVPILGWALLFVMMTYLEIWTFVKLHHGVGERYIKH